MSLLNGDGSVLIHRVRSGDHGGPPAHTQRSRYHTDPSHMEAPTFPLWCSGLVQPESSGLDGLEVRWLWLCVLSSTMMLCADRNGFNGCKPNPDLCTGVVRCCWCWRPGSADLPVAVGGAAAGSVVDHLMDVAGCEAAALSAGAMVWVCICQPQQHEWSVLSLTADLCHQWHVKLDFAATWTFLMGQAVDVTFSFPVKGLGYVHVCWCACLSISGSPNTPTPPVH